MIQGHKVIHENHRDDHGGGEDKVAVDVLDHYGVDGVPGVAWRAGSVTLLVQTSAGKPDQ